MVDNVVSGALGWRRGLTFDYTPQRHDVESLLHTIGRDTGRLAQNILEAYERRGEAMAGSDCDQPPEPGPRPSRLEFSSPRSTRPRRRGLSRARRRSSLHGDVHDVVALVAERLSADATATDPFASWEWAK